MITINSITKGFDRELTKKIMATSSHIRIRPINSKGFPDWKNALTFFQSQKYLNGISPRFECDTIIDGNSFTTGLRVIGIIPKYEKTISPFLRKFNRKFKEKNWIIIGDELFKETKLQLGDTVTLRGFENSMNFVIEGTFSVGLYDYDYSFAYISLENSNKLYEYPNIATSLNINIKNLDDLNKIVNSIHKKIPDLNIKTWRELNNSVVKTMKLEEIVIKLIIFLTSSLSLIGVVLLLFVNIEKRKNIIGILFVNGLQKKSIKMIFFIEGVIISSLGIMGGVLSGLFLSYSISTLTIKLPNEINETYGSNFIPVNIIPEDIIFIIATTFLLSILITWIITIKISSIKIINLLKN